MLDFPRWKIILVALVCFGAILLALPNAFREGALPEWMPSKQVNLGLDLRGGSYLLLDVDFDTYVAEQMDGLIGDARMKLRGENIGYTRLTAIGDAIHFTLRDTNDREKISALASQIDSNLQAQMDESGAVQLRFSDQELERMRTRVLEQSIEIVRRRVDETGTREPIIQRQGDGRILLQVPGLDNPEKLKNLLGQTAKMTFHLVDMETPVSEAKQGNLPFGSKLLPYDESERKPGHEFVVIKKKIMLSGEMLVDSQATFEQGRPVVSFRFNTRGAKKFGEITQQNVGRLFAIVLDGKVISAPVIREPIMGGSGIISGTYTVESANDLALLLRAGALPAPLTVAEERTVGPSLGADSIAAGTRAFLLGIVLVMGFMLLAYGRFGIYSDIALVMNMILILAALSLFQATLTLPGIAGIVLTIGMAVDANVLIFERIREEIRLGKTPFAAVDNGFRRAFKTIADSNITTLIVAILLFYFGSGTVKGFAVTLSIGILASMFSAILLTRMMVTLWVKKARPKALPI